MIEPARVSARRAPRPGLVVFGQPRYDGGRRQLTGRGKNMSTASAKLMTAEEFYDFCHRPENRDRHFELEQGEVVEVSRPGVQHGAVCINVGVVLTLYARQRRQGYACGNDTGVIWGRAPDTVKGPDVIFFDQNHRFDELAIKY